MKKCNTELMKDVKALLEKKDDLLVFEKENWTITFVKGEEIITTAYDYSQVRDALKKIDDEVKRLKQLLAYSNATTIVEDFNMTISEALVYLAQMNQNRSHLSKMEKIPELKRISTCYSNSQIEFTKANFDSKKVKEELTILDNLIPKLQMAIDRTNLTNMIDC